MKRSSTTVRLGLPLTLALILVGCSTQPADQRDEGAGGGASPEATPSPEASETVSILRPEIAPPELAEEPLEPLNATIGFPAGGTGLDGDAVAALEEVLASEQFALAGPIILRAHSDSAGSDAVNQRSSEARGLAVAEWLIGQGVDADRITVIPFGEQNPVEPNALPDGSPNEDGRAANRRVEVLIVPPDAEITDDDAGGTEAAGGVEASGD